MSGKLKSILDLKSVGALLALFLLISVSALFWMEVNKRFPVPPPGHYIGKISNLSTGETPLFFYLDRGENSSVFTISLLASGIKPYVGNLPQSAGQRMVWADPVVLESDELPLRFIGSQVRDDFYSGTVRSLDSGAEGNWQYWKVSLGNREKNSMALLELRQRLILLDEVYNADQRLRYVQERVSAQRKEIERLGDVITEGEGIRLDGESQFESVTRERERLETTLDKKRAEAKELEKKLDIAQRLTKQGKLVSLSRQLRDRENRWIDSMLRTELASESPQMKDSIERGYQILQVKRLLQEEKQKIAALQSGELDGYDSIGAIPYEDPNL